MKTVCALVLCWVLAVNGSDFLHRHVQDPATAPPSGTEDAPAANDAASKSTAEGSGTAEPAGDTPGAEGQHANGGSNQGSGAAAAEPAGETPAEDEAERTGEAKAVAGSATPLEGPAHSDNFQDELVDQADPEFDKVSGGDECISWEDSKKPLEQQFQEGAPDRATMSEAEIAEQKAVQKDMLSDMKLMFDNADQNKDGCVDKKEFKKAGEMEGPPPGFERGKKESMSEAEFEKQMRAEERLEFDAMDRSGDGKVSQSEAYHYASENMPQADVNKDDMDDMFAAADTNGDGFITFEEFSGAGEEIEGDGNEMESAEPMGFKVFTARKRSMREVAKRKMLAQRPPLVVTSRLLSAVLLHDEPADEVPAEESGDEAAPEGEAGAEADSGSEAEADSEGGEVPADAADDAVVPEAERADAPAESGESVSEATAQEAAAPAQPAKDLEGPAHSDNFQDELVDQADPEFKKMSGGDDCISWEDTLKTLEKQFQEGAPDQGTVSEADRAANEEIKSGMISDMKLMYHNADKNKDGCVDRKEFKAAGELEGPPPGFQGAKTEEMGKTEFEEESANEDRFEFDAMDRSGDGKISKSEAYHYVNDNMPQADADMSEVDAMFSDTDTNKDGFITFDEFTQAGQQIEGDGNEMESAEPIGLNVYLRRRRHSRKAKKASLLAHKAGTNVMQRWMEASLAKEMRSANREIWAALREQFP